MVETHRSEQRQQKRVMIGEPSKEQGKIRKIKGAPFALCSHTSTITVTDLAFKPPPHTSLVAHSNESRIHTSTIAHSYNCHAPRIHAPVITADQAFAVFESPIHLERPLQGVEPYIFPCPLLPESQRSSRKKSTEQAQVSSWSGSAQADTTCRPDLYTLSSLSS